MEEFSEFLGWANVGLFAAVILGGLLLRFGGLKRSRAKLALAHRVFTVLALFSLAAHFLLVEQRPWILIAVAALLVLLPVATIILKKMKRLKSAVTMKLVVLPIIAAVLLFGHLSYGESEDEGGHPDSGYEASDD